MEPQNLLVIMADEHNASAMGCAGHDIVRTPHIDALAARGTRFTSAYTNSPICVPARAAFATGQYVHRAHYWDNSFGYDGRVPSWGHALQAAGHRVESIGKLHYQNAEFDTGFDAQHIPMHLANGVGMVQGSIRGQFPDFRPARKFTPGKANIVMQAGEGESSYTLYDRKISRLACEWLEGAAGQKAREPWCLFVSFVTPHYPLIAPAEFLAPYLNADIPLPLLDNDPDYIRHPWWASKAGPVEGLDSDDIRRAVASYYGLCSFADAMVGNVLAALEGVGLSASTRVIYTSDHGECLGKRGLWGKSVMYREATEVPLVLVGKDIAAGALCDTAVSLIDAYPSVLQALGVEGAPAAERPGRSWFETALLPCEERAVFSEYHAMGSPSAAYMLRKGRFKYHYYAGGFDAELFDLDADPDERINLARESAHASTVSQFEDMLRSMLDPEATDAAAKQSQKALVELHGGPEAVVEKFATGSKAYTDVPAELLV